MAALIIHDRPAFSQPEECPGIWQTENKKKIFNLAQNNTNMYYIMADHTVSTCCYQIGTQSHTQTH